MNIKGTKIGSVAVLMGGWSAEREISLKTGSAVLRALEKLGRECWAVDVDRQLANKLSEKKPDIAFIALHGKGGEDGAVQGLLEVLGIAYTGSGILSSSLAMNKKYSKWLFERHSIKTPPYILVSAEEVPAVGQIPFGFPLIVKPVSEGSTIGVSIVQQPEGLQDALLEAFKYGKEALVEKFIDGRELTVGIIGRRALPPLEIIPEKGFYDYQAKYQSSETRYRVPADIPDALADQLSSMALSAVSVLDCRGAARVDFRVDGDGVPYILEVNTIPGMTESSLLPKAAGSVGLSFEKLVEEIVIQAMEDQ